MTSSNGLTVLSAFSGAGGFDLGFSGAGFRNVGCIEVSPLPRATIAANRPEWKLIEPGDVTAAAAKLKPEDVGLRRGHLTALIAGPPCQPFSKAAQWANSGRRGLKDDRTRCLEGLMSLVRSFEPAILVLENVQGFVQGPGEAISWLHTELRAINEMNGTSYCLDFRLIDAAEYGVPQHRVRAILVATRDGSAFCWPEATTKTNPISAWEAIGELQPAETPVATGKWAPLLATIPEGKNYLWHTDRGGGLPLFGYRARYWSFLLKLGRQRPSWTLPAHPGPATGPFHWANRPLAVEEALRLQSFPMNWSLAGGYREKIQQIGNATPPLLAEQIARSAAFTLLGSLPTSRLTHEIERNATPLPPLEDTGAVPAAFLSLVGNHEAHPGPGKGPKPIATVREDE